MLFSVIRMYVYTVASPQSYNNGSKTLSPRKSTVLCNNIFSFELRKQVRIISSTADSGDLGTRREQETENLLMLYEDPGRCCTDRLNLVHIMPFFFLCLIPTLSTVLCRYFIVVGLGTTYKTFSVTASSSLTWIDVNSCCLQMVKRLCMSFEATWTDHSLLEHQWTTTKEQIECDPSTCLDHSLKDLKFVNFWHC